MNRNAALIASCLFGLAVGCGGDSTSGDGSGGSTATGGTSGSGSGGTPSSGGSFGTLPPEATACDQPSDCIVSSETCCGSCGQPTRDDIVALNVEYRDDHRKLACDDNQGCPACYMAPDPTLLATCEAGQCVAVDLLEHESTACSDASECRLRTPECCECGGTTDEEALIAVSTSAASSYGALVCDPGTACPECAPLYPDLPVDCVSGHCEVVRTF